VPEGDVPARRSPSSLCINPGGRIINNNGLQVADLLMRPKRRSIMSGKTA
jgi:hypothetical protein